MSASTQPATRNARKMPDENIKALTDRMTGAEHDIKNLIAGQKQNTEAITRLIDSQRDGFDKIQEIFRESEAKQEERARETEKKHDERTNELRSKFADRNQVNWALIVSVIVAAFVVGGAIVAFVNMTVDPINKDVIETRTDVDHHIELGGHTEALIKHARAEEQIKDAHFEIEKLHNFSDTNIAAHQKNASSLAAMETQLEDVTKQQDLRWQEIIAGAERRGKLDEAVTNMRAAIDSILLKIDSSTGDRFYGREGEALKTELRDLRNFVTELATQSTNETK